MKLPRACWMIVWATATMVAGRTWAADPLPVTDKSFSINVPIAAQPLELQLHSSLSTLYAPEPAPDATAGMLRLANVALEEGVRYPSVGGGIYAGNSIGEKLLPSGKDGFPMMTPNNTYLTSWLNKQWATVSLNLAHTHQLEKTGDQLVAGASKAVAVFQDALFFSVGEYLVNDLNTRYWSRTTDLVLDYGWQHWDFSMAIEQREDSTLRAQSVWAAIKKKF